MTLVGLECSPTTLGLDLEGRGVARFGDDSARDHHASPPLTGAYERAPAPRRGGGAPAD
ncbi:hypothetical protein C8035_v000468 [Colletotrichum spinosum]|uniref:Uncharacterized protein n=1 Tax=Colletotrichum spinosum TaxID=1347390 RepID=A0A4R8PQT2_9PEZI|nr:hypothetical protein C8035_v000468 [Colletotrichum spinosum]